MIDVLGWCGAGVLLLAYALVSAKRLTGDGIVFQLLNLVGGLSLAINSAWFGAWPSAALNVVWVGIGVVTIGTLAARRTRKKAGPLPEGERAGVGR